jgi:hypothetical protein
MNVGTPRRPRQDAIRVSVANVGIAVALTLPGLVLMLLLVAAVDQVVLRVRGRGLLSWRGDAQVSSTGFELLHAALSPGKADELAQRHTQELVRDDEAGAAPPRSRIDFGRGVAYVRLPARERQPCVAKPTLPVATFAASGGKFRN